MTETEYDEQIRVRTDCIALAMWIQSLESVLDQMPDLYTVPAIDQANSLDAMCSVALGVVEKFVRQNGGSSR